MTTRLDFATLDLMDALDLAVLIEAEAYERYRLFVTQLGHRFPGDASSVFATMVRDMGADYRVVQAYLGQAPRDVLGRHYEAISVDRMRREVVARLDTAKVGGETRLRTITEPAKIANVENIALRA